MTSSELLVDAFGRIREVVHQVVDGLTPDELAFRVDPEANTIAWLVWHLTRVQDDHVAELADVEQVWSSDGWAERFGLPFAPDATGYGHCPDDVAAVRVPSGNLVVQYHEAVFSRTREYVESLTDDDLDRVVDRSWDPPVTLGVRLVSVIDDELEHAGQAAFLHGVVVRRRADR